MERKWVCYLQLKETYVGTQWKSADSCTSVSLIELRNNNILPFHVLAELNPHRTPGARSPVTDGAVMSRLRFHEIPLALTVKSS